MMVAIRWYMATCGLPHPTPTRLDYLRNCGTKPLGMVGVEIVGVVIRVGAGIKVMVDVRLRLGLVLGLGLC